MLLQEIGNKIKNRRNELGLTQLVLARMADVSLNTLYLLESGRMNVSLKTLEKILDILGLEINLEVKKLK
ncbi:MAG: helix-turn-helix domain-containing protein [Ignavibacteria bacterium]